MLPSNPNLMLTNRVTQVMLYLREYWIISNQVIVAIDTGGLTGLFLMDKLNACTQIRTKLGASIGGGKNSAVRDKLASEFAIADINTELSTTNIATSVMLTAMSDLLVVVAGRGQIVIADDVNGKVDSVISPPDSDSLRAATIQVRDVAIRNPSN